MDARRTPPAGTALDAAAVTLAAVGLVLSGLNVDTPGFLVGLVGALYAPIAFVRSGSVRVLHLVAVVLGVTAMVLSLIDTI